MRGLRVLRQFASTRSRSSSDSISRSLPADLVHTNISSVYSSPVLCRLIGSLAPRISLAPRAYPSGDGDRWNEEYNARTRHQNYEERAGDWIAGSDSPSESASAPVRGSSRKADKKKNIKPHKYQKSFKLRTEKYMQPFMLDVFFSKRFITAAIMHRVTSRVIAVCNTNSKEFRGKLKSYCDLRACQLVGRLVAERAIEADVYAVVYEPRKNEKFEGKLKTLVDTVGENGIHLHL